jgi:hypothetical protein
MRPPGRPAAPGERPPGRTDASGWAATSGRATPTGTARVPTGTARVPVDARPGMGGERRQGGDERDYHPSGTTDLWSPSTNPRREGRRSSENTSGVRRGEDTGGVRRGENTSGVRRGERGPQQQTGPRRTSLARPPERPADTARSAPDRRLIVLWSAAVVVALAIGIGGYVVLRTGPARSPSHQSEIKAAPTKPRDISTRDIDPAALTEHEVFPGPQITVGAASYQVLKTQATDCPSAATDDLAKLLGQLGCSQVVRGTLKSGNAQFLITAGVFNLKDEASANQAYESIKPTLDAQKGRFTGLLAGEGTEAIVRAPTTLGWHPRGHFLAYCLVAHTDGTPVAADDAGSKQVISDLVESHLRDGVIGARAVVPPTASAAPK